MTASSETVIVGGGHAGLALSYHLGRLGRPHLILERGRVAERWRSERWDSLMFQFPNWSLRLPGQEYRGDDPDGFATRDEVIALHRALPRARSARPCGPACAWIASARSDGGFRLETTDGARSRPPTSSSPPAPIRSRSCRPSGTPSRPTVVQVHASGYRNPAQLPAGRGAGGRLRRLRLPDRGGPARGGPDRVLLGGPPPALSAPLPRPRHVLVDGADRRAGPDARRAPRGARAAEPARHRGRRRPRDRPPRLRGRPASRCWGICATSPARGSTWPTTWRRCWPRATRASACSRARWMPTSRGPVSRRRRTRRPRAPPSPRARRRRRSASSIWPLPASRRWSGPPASGATSAGSTRPSSTSEASRSIGAGVTGCAGLYFLGLPWLHKLKSSVLCGVGDDAAHLADHIAAGAARPRPGLIRRA